MYEYFIELESIIIKKDQNMVVKECGPLLVQIVLHSEERHELKIHADKDMSIISWRGALEHYYDENHTRQLIWTPIHDEAFGRCELDDSCIRITGKTGFYKIRVFQEA